MNEITFDQSYRNLNVIYRMSNLDSCLTSQSIEKKILFSAYFVRSATGNESCLVLRGILRLSRSDGYFPDHEIPN